LEKWGVAPGRKNEFKNFSFAGDINIVGGGVSI
jgi:hypothetical protein